MSAWISMLRGGLLLDTRTFLALRGRRDAMLVAAAFIVVVALLAGLPAFIIDLADGVQAHPFTEADATQVLAGVEQGLAQAQASTQNLPPEVAMAIRQGVETAVQIARAVDALPTGLPRPVTGGLQALGRWLSRPFAGGVLPLAAASLATWLGYGVWVMLAARALGGRAELREFFGTTGLFAGPHLLNVFGLIPVVGPIVGVLVALWGLVIYVKATAVSNDLDTGRALLAVVLPAVIFAILTVLALLLVVVWIALAAARS